MTTLSKTNKAWSNTNLTAYWKVTETTNAVENSERKQLSILLHLIAKWHVEKSVITSKYAKISQRLVYIV